MASSISFQSCEEESYVAGSQQIENNQAILLRVHSVSHHTAVIDGRIHYSAVVHFKAES
ncbi:DUF2536 family protein [Bacillus licheniformis]|nr:DUF2536 family protein [Bacillus licheniformis]